jgi:hypothetical protein
MKNCNVTIQTMYGCPIAEPKEEDTNSIDIYEMYNKLWCKNRDNQYEIRKLHIIIIFQMVTMVAVTILNML